MRALLDTVCDYPTAGVDVLYTTNYSISSGKVMIVSWTCGPIIPWLVVAQGGPQHNTIHLLVDTVKAVWRQRKEKSGVSIRKHELFT